MKKNLLHMIIIAITLNFVQIHTMENQQLTLQAQQNAFQAKYQSLPRNNNEKAITKTLIDTNNPKLMTQNNNKQMLEEEGVYTFIALDDTDIPLTKIDISSHTQHNQGTNHATPLTQTVDPTSITNLLTQDNNIHVHCCDRNLICTKATATKIGCAGCMITALLACVIALPFIVHSL